jgi:hypothetical protein
MLALEKAPAIIVMVFSAIALATYVLALLLSPRTAQSDNTLRRVAQEEETMIRSVEGGVQSGGYIDGRPVPSGFEMPVIVRWRPRDASQNIRKVPPVEADLIGP